VAIFEDVSELALQLPQATEGERHGNRAWSVGGKVFAWERQFSKADLRRFGAETPPDGPIIAVSVADLHEKEAILAANPDALFTIPHFDGYAAVLVELRKVSLAALRAVLTDGWLSQAPRDLAEHYVGH
jgi:hypothetical protein